MSVHRGGRWYTSMPCSRSRGGCAIPACIAGGIPACLATGLQGGGGSAPRGCLVWGSLLPGGGSAPRWCAWSRGLVSQHALRQTPQKRRLLLRTVRIPLECILVYHSKYSVTVQLHFCNQLHYFLSQMEECFFFKQNIF